MKDSRFPCYFLLLAMFLYLLPPDTTAQSTAADIEQAIRERKSLAAQSLLKHLPARNIGPNVQGGRITDIEVDPRNDKVYYVGYASGGLFKTTTNGQTFEPVFDGYGALGVGDFSLCRINPDVIWLGTGENNSSRSSYAGAGMYRSTDGGKTWEAAGLTGTQHIGRVIAHPSDPNTAWVASIGALYTENEDRGIYKTHDGGKTWKKILFVNSNTGIIDLVIDPNNPKKLWAAAWERSRKAWEFDEDGPGSGIYYTADGGATWNKSMNGIPEGERTGRIGLAISPSNTNVLYALLDNQDVDESRMREDTIAGITSRALTSMSQEDFLQLEDSKLDSFLRGKGYPKKYKAKGVKQDIKDGKYDVEAVAKYFGDANEALFNTGVKGAEIYRSDDGGQHWKLMTNEVLSGVYFTYGYYFGQIRIAPDNPDEIYVFGVPLLRSQDGGTTWMRLDSQDVHVDHHELWIHPNDPNHLILGNDGGLYISYNRGTNWTHLDNLSVGQFYTVMVDMQQPYNVYGGLQDNGVLKGSSRSIPNKTKKWERIFGGDGMFIVTDEKDRDLVYTGFQFGNYFRIKKGQPPKYLTPKHDIGAPKYRWNWRSPMRASPHNHEIIYFGAQYLFRSMDMGDNWERISPDLTTDYKPQSNVPYSTITTISESPTKFGLIWVGTDDGRVQVTTDGGNTWKNVSNGLPPKLWVSKVFASPHDQQTAFVSLTGYRNDDFRTYVYKTTDLGRTWTSLKGNLPDEGINVIIQDAKVADMLYLGSDHATYISLDGGKAWHHLGTLPNVASYDMMVHPRENELVVATHGRSMYVLDIKPLQALADLEDGQQLMVFAPKEIRWSKRWGTRDHPYQEYRAPKVGLHFFTTEGPAEGRALTLTVRDGDKQAVHTMDITAMPGYNALQWDLNVGTKEKKKYLKPGTYTLEYKMGFETREVELKVKKK